MLTKLQKFFAQQFNKSTSTTVDITHQLQLACATLLIEMLYVDDIADPQEEVKLRQILQQQHALDEAEINALILLATQSKHQATDYYQFTALLNEHYSPQQKTMLIKNLWQIAYADKQLDKHEEHLLRRLADLLHVPHKHFLQTKHKVVQELNA